MFKHMLTAISLVISLAGTVWSGDTNIRVVDRPNTGLVNNFYVGNRPPLIPSPFMKLPVGTIEPQGWVRRQLELQADGFHGHLTEISQFLKKDGNAWLSPTGEGDHGWEEPAYWLKGFSNCGYILRNERMIAESKIWIEAALASQKEDGWFGPDKGRKGAATRLQGREDLWPNMIMLFCLQNYYEFTSDPRVIDLMTNYMTYLTTVLEEQFLVGYWPKMRGGDLLYSVYWLYNRTGDAFLLDLARMVHRRTAEWEKDVINWHNVNMSQGFGEAATFYMQSKNPAHLEAAERNWSKIRNLYGQVPGGMFGGDENCREGFTDPRQAVETCGMVEMMLSHEILLTISGDPIWADRCEDVAFNSLPAAFTPDLKALHYLTAPNMILCDRHNKSPGLQNRGPMLLFDPHRHRCCQHNTGHGWPYYAEHLWLAAPGNGLAAVLYAPCKVTAKVGDGTQVTIIEETRYPFDEDIELTVKTSKPVRFPLYLRVPGWCQRPEVTMNKKMLELFGPGSYIEINRQWTDGDKLTLTLPMKITLRKWTQNKDSISVDRGPLTYSLKIGEKYIREGGTDEWPAWEIHPTTAWNYGLVLNEDDPTSSFEVVRKSWPDDDQPFEATATPIELRAKAKKIPAWQKDHLGLVGRLQASPVKSDEPTETVTLIPMGCARLRISSFPTIGSGPDAHEWKEPPKTRPATAQEEVRQILQELQHLFQFRPPYQLSFLTEFELLSGSRTGKNINQGDKPFPYYKVEGLVRFSGDKLETYSVDAKLNNDNDFQKSYEYHSVWQNGRALELRKKLTSGREEAVTTRVKLHDGIRRDSIGWFAYGVFIGSNHFSEDLLGVPELKIARETGSSGGQLLRIEGETPSGTLTVWLNIEKPATLKRASFKASSNFASQFETNAFKLDVEVLEYTKIGDAPFPTKAVATYTYDIPGNTENNVNRLTTTSRQIQVNPDFGSMNAFHIDIPEGKIVEDYGAHITYKWVRGELQVVEGDLIPLMGKALPELKDLGIDLSPADTDEKEILVCFFDMEQRPSRNCLRRLSEQAQELKAKDVVIVAVQVSKIDGNTLSRWVKKSNIPFPVGMVQDNEANTRFAWAVKALPWLILADQKHIVIFEGFQLSEMADQLVPGGPKRSEE